ALERQRSVPAFEVVLVDDASEDDTLAVVAEIAQATSLDLRYIRLDRNQGPAVARNAGWRSTDARMIAFTDDDCVPQPDWLSALLRGLDQADLAQGKTVIDPDEPVDGLFAWAPETTEERGFYETYNIAYRRKVLAQANG